MDIYISRVFLSLARCASPKKPYPRNTKKAYALPPRSASTQDSIMKILRIPTAILAATTICSAQLVIDNKKTDEKIPVINEDFLIYKANSRESFEGNQTGFQNSAMADTFQQSHKKQRFDWKTSALQTGLCLTATAIKVISNADGTIRCGN